MNVPPTSLHHQAPPAVRPAHVIVYGRRRASWAGALGAGSPAWDGIRSAGEVELLASRVALRRRAKALTGDLIVLPLNEADILSSGDAGWGLRPSPKAVRILSDKQLFADYALSAGLGGDIPAPYPHDAPTFPCVAKRAVSHSGRRVAVVNSANELGRLRRRLHWLGRRVILQGLVEGDDHVLHAVCRGGRILWHCVYRYELEAGDVIQRPHNVVERHKDHCSAADIAVFERFLVPLSFDGPVAIDFKRRGGRPCIIEINPRLGGSLKRADNAGDLHGALAAIVANAVPLGGQ